jgi:DNA ligase-1
MFRPMLCPQKDPMGYANYFRELRYPLLCSPKIDGIRAVVKGGVVMSRKFKPLPSAQVQFQFGPYEHFDGEIAEGNPADHDVCNRTQSHVMSKDKPGDIRLYAFDYTAPDWLHRPFHERLEKIQKIIGRQDDIEVLEHHLVEREEELLDYEERMLAAGFEGLVMRDPVGVYKQGRGTWGEGLIYKLKRFEDTEGVIVGVEEQMTNLNELKHDALGYAERSTTKDGLFAAGTLGAFVVDLDGQAVSVAPGVFDHEERRRIWLNKEMYIGNESVRLKFRFFGRGAKNLPRFPRAIGFRDMTIDG